MLWWYFWLTVHDADTIYLEPDNTIHGPITHEPQFDAGGMHDDNPAFSFRIVTFVAAQARRIPGKEAFRWDGYQKSGLAGCVSPVPRSSGMIFRPVVSVEKDGLYMKLSFFRVCAIVGQVPRNSTENCGDLQRIVLSDRGDR